MPRFVSWTIISAWTIVSAVSLSTAMCVPTDDAVARQAGFYVDGAYYRESPLRPAPSHTNETEPATPPMPVPRPRSVDSHGDGSGTKPDAAPLKDASPAKPSEPPIAAPEPPSAHPQNNAIAPLPKPAELDKPAELAAPSAIPTGHPAATEVMPGKPPVMPSGAAADVSPRSPEEDPACVSRLVARHVEVEPIAIGPQADPRCSVVQAVRLTGLSLPGGGTVAFPDRPTIACTTADVFSLYVRDLLDPLAKGTFNAPVAAVWTGPGLECRARDHIFGAKLSAHGQGLAIDIAQMKLADGRLIAVGEPKTDSDVAFETASRAGACGYFHTVLGPGSDSYHRTHWHFDLEVRGTKGDTKYCR